LLFLFLKFIFLKQKGFDFGTNEKFSCEKIFWIIVSSAPNSH